MSRDALEAFWTSGAPLRQAMPGYQIRPSQVEMSRWVQDALEDGQTRVIEAGTGIGKTFAYLAPVLLGSQRVIISTATLALQDQLMDRDLPRCARRPARGGFAEGTWAIPGPVPLPPKRTGSVVQ